MLIRTIDASGVKKCFLAGAGAINNKKEEINDLNVFPVPDGDTGTNMTMTIMSAAAEVEALDDVEMKALCKAVSSGSLRGARGNSGVILSQLLRGFTKEIRETDEVDVNALARAFERAVEAAYKAVMKPKEGTILTVARAGADRAVEMAEQTDNLVEFGNSVLMHMRDVLEKTPDMLPVLKEAGVVDSGGEGLLTILQGAFDSLIGKEVELSADVGRVQADVSKARPGMAVEEDIKFGYCTEYIIMTEKRFDSSCEREFKAYLETIGDSIVCVADDDIVKVHVHTNDPGLAIQKGLSYGELSRMKIDNMREEHHERVINSGGAAEPAKNAKTAAPSKEQNAPVKEQNAPVKEQNAPVKEHRENGFISVSAGEGLSEVFRELGVDVVIEGGQTMNPSTEDILRAVDEISADHIFILPNNSNIILAAEQVKNLARGTSVEVIPSKNIPQGIAAMIAFVDGMKPEENVQAMTEALETVKAGQVTYAVRDTNMDGRVIQSGDIIGITDKTIEASGTDIVETTIELLKKMTDEDSELITIYYGQEASEEEAEKIAAGIRKENDAIEVEIQYGGQPIYYYFVSVE